MADPADKPGRAVTGRVEDREPGRPHHTPRTRADKAARQARLAAELRSNLLKRKRQQRARGDASGSDDG
jgi:hypothetical protein